MKEEFNNSKLINKDEIIKPKREKLKKIQVRRSIKDILIDQNPCDYIYNYTGKNINVFPENLLNNNSLKESFIESENEKRNSEKEIINSISIDDHEKRLLIELKELLNKKDLTNEMKDNIKSLFIEVQEFYLEIKNDLKINYPSTKDLLQLYSTDECDKNSKNIIWKSFCFYKLLSDQLNDLHISTISSYRLQCLRTIYRWYNKNKRMLFNYKNDKRMISLFDEKRITDDSLYENFVNTNVSSEEEKKNIKSENMDIVEKEEDNKEKKEDIKEEKEDNIEKKENIKEKEENIKEINMDNNEEKIENESSIKKEYSKELSEDFDSILKEYVLLKNEKDEAKKEIELNAKNKTTDDESNAILNNYIFPNSDLMNSVEQEKKDNCLKEGIYMEKEEEKREESKEDIKKENTNTHEEWKCKNLGKFKSSDNFHFNSTSLDDCKDDLFQIPIDTEKIKELEEEIKKQKLLIKKKEIEIINSPIGIKFKDIFGNFQDIDINN